MNSHPIAEAAAFSEELRAFIAKNLPADSAERALANASEWATQVPRLRRDLKDLTDFARQSAHHADTLWNDKQFQVRVVTLQAELDALEHTQTRAIECGGAAGVQLGLMVTITASELRQKVNELIVQALGPVGLASQGAEALPDTMEAPGAGLLVAFRNTAPICNGINNSLRDIIDLSDNGAAKLNSGLAAEDAKLRDSIDRFTAAEYTLPKRAALLAGNRDNWDHFAAMGWIGGSLSSMMLVAERMGAGLAIEPFVGSVVYTSQVLNTLLGVPGAAKLLAPVVAGQTRLAMACHEAPSRGGLRWTGATATPDGDGYVLDGCKVAVDGGGAATAYLVSARTAGDIYDPFGHSLFLVPRDAPGVKVHAWRMIDGSDMAAVELDGVRVSKDALLGEPGTALGAFSAGMDAAIVGSAFAAIGAMEAAITVTTAQLSEGGQSGGATRDHRFLRHRCADMLMDLEQARSAALLGLDSLLKPDARQRAYVTSVTKAVAARASNAVCGQAIQLHREIGAAADGRIDQLFNLVAAANLHRGSPDFHLSRMAMLM